MSSALPSDEVAEDYKNSLEDLTTNDRFQISNLTVIAKENTEHAMAISRVLENHIRSVGVSFDLWITVLDVLHVVLSCEEALMVTFGRPPLRRNCQLSM